MLQKKKKKKNTTQAAELGMHLNISEEKQR